MDRQQYPQSPQVETHFSYLPEKGGPTHYMFSSVLKCKINFYYYRFEDIENM